MNKDKFCFSKTLTYLVLLVVAVAGFFYITNYYSQQKRTLNSQAVFRNHNRLEGGPTLTPVAISPVFTLTDLKTRAQVVLNTLAVAKNRSATMDTVSIQAQIDDVVKKTGYAATYFKNLKGTSIQNLLSNLRIKKSGVDSLKNIAKTSYDNSYNAYNGSVNLYNDAVKYAGGRPKNINQTELKNNMAVLKAKMIEKQVDFKSYEYLLKLIDEQILKTNNINLALVESKRLPDKIIINTNDRDLYSLNVEMVKQIIKEIKEYISVFNNTLDSTYATYNQLDTAIKNAGGIVTTQVQAYRNYCSNVKPGTYYSIEGIDTLSLDKAQQYYDDYCGQNATGYGWNGIVGDGAVCYTATGLCSPIIDCKKVDCISRIGKGFACLNKPVTDNVGKAACASKYQAKLGIDIFTKNACPQNNSNKIGWYGGRDYKITNPNGTIDTISGSDSCLRLNAANKGPSSCNQLISDNYCGCKDAGFTYVKVNGTYKNMVDELYGNKDLYRPQRSTSNLNNISEGFEKCPFKIN